MRSIPALIFATLILTPVASAADPAHEAAKLFRHGVNLGNYFEVPPGGGWQSPFELGDLKEMREQGFDHVRIPVGWHHYTGPGPQFAIDPEFYQRVDEVVETALAERLAVMVNIHHFKEMNEDPAGEADRFVAIWRQLAKHYRDKPSPLVFELLNEPHGKATAEVMNGLYARAIGASREVDEERVIVVGPADWNSAKGLAKLQLPEEDRRLIVTFHCYDPFVFTHQDAGWSGMKGLKGVRFPGPPAEPLAVPEKFKGKWQEGWIKRYNTLPAEKNPCSVREFEKFLDQAVEWGKANKRPLHLGEFGAYKVADQESRNRFYRAMREAAEKRGIGWAIWAWHAGFDYWDGKKKEPVPGMRKALFE
jgi:endoglucanase